LTHNRFLRDYKKIRGPQFRPDLCSGYPRGTHFSLDNVPLIFYLFTLHASVFDSVRQTMGGPIRIRWRAKRHSEKIIHNLNV
jgi:hypothetical protein